MIAGSLGASTQDPLQRLVAMDAGQSERKDADLEASEDRPRFDLVSKQCSEV